MDLIRQTGYAAFEMDAGYRLQGGEQACDYTAAFRSVIGEGSVREVTDPEEKKAGLTAILRQRCGDAGLQGASVSAPTGGQYGKEERTYADFSGD